ncbi:MAG TPA: flavin reductase family protein [Rugosimonospora sp.]|nr:flavin reductase family protein [Rugosimonospora sp.]
MTIHSTDPFATPDDRRSPVRQWRGRLPAPVTLWTATGPAGPAGLTVSSLMVADGAPGRLLGLVDEESELWEALRGSGRFAVAVLAPGHRQLADRFAGLMPAPGGPFRGYEWTETPYGPVPADVPGWAGCRLDASRTHGWALLVEATIEQIEIDGSGDPLVHFRGRYRGLV